MVVTCPTNDTALAIDQSAFWDQGGVHWDSHRIGWAIAGGCAALTSLVTLVSLIRHSRNYYVRDEQRQIIRILYLPPVFAIISFFSYRFFRDYTYYSLVESIYEAFVISAFLLLLVQYVAATSASHTAEGALVRKDKHALPFPFCCWRYRPTKPGFMYTIKWAVMQYTIIRPAVSIAGIICQFYNVLCDSVYSVHFASVYLSAIDFVSISVALYGLFLFYGLTKEELGGRRPLAKFLCIKLIVMATFYQSFVFSTLQSHGVIKSTEFWTASDITDGLNALATTIEMVFFAFFMMWAYPSSEYPSEGRPHTNIFRPIWDSLNFSDFFWEIISSLKFFVDYARGKPDTRAQKDRLESGQVDFGRAFGLNPELQGSHGGGSRSRLASPTNKGESWKERQPSDVESYTDEGLYTYGRNDSFAMNSVGRQ